MKVLVAAGGTGGHFYPGLAVAKALIREGNDVFFLVRKNDYVIPLLERESIPFVTIAAAGLQRRMSISNLFLPIKLALGFLEAFLHLVRLKPSLVLVMGGYVSVPPALAAKLLMIPVVLHEQNLTPGLANRLLSWVAAKVAVSFKDSEPYFKGMAVVTGNPIRPEFSALTDKAAAVQSWGLDPKKKTVLVFGGSLGSHSLNQLMVEALKQLEDFAGTYQILHVTGKSDEASIAAAYRELKFHHAVVDYCHDMPKAYSAADLIVSRAGASTVAELFTVKKPAILIPYPFATGDHQLLNARVLSDVGAGLVLEEKFLKGGELRNQLRRLMTDNGLLDRMSKGYERIHEDPLLAVGKIVTVLQSVVKGSLVNCWFV
jgi:UDP-N-acetylglucosamine--N-acetylmuramyl-(pentapeptide) pyrophosphoryl-undecaprenol N-acetylglucosamine transferase